jgi:hypothetical protein
METPFDSLIARLWRRIFNSYQRNSSVSEELSLAMTFSRIARVLYVNIAVASEKMLAQTYSLSNPSGSRIITLEEKRELEDGPIECKLSYMHFVEHINRTGRAFKRKGFPPPPLYARIYFFRNKMVEHWEDYLQFLTHENAFSSSTQSSFMIPHAFAAKSKLDSAKVQQELTDAFADYGVTLPSLEALEDKSYAEYSDVLYSALEKIDKQLRNHNEKNGVGIPETIVRLLFKYSFPTPIYDIEGYCKILVAWLEALPLQ